MPVYSYGVDSNLKIEISDSDAEIYNRVSGELSAVIDGETITDGFFAEIDNADLRIHDYVADLLERAEKALDLAGIPIETYDVYLTRN